MSKLLAQLLETSTDQLGQTLGILEKMSGYPAVDARLIADIEAGQRSRLDQLELDPADTLGPELYQQLRLKIADQAKQWFRAQPIESLSLTEKLTADLKRLKVPRTTWALQGSAVKTLLSALPPKQVMKKLHYRSAASMLKYQNAYELYAAARLHESAAWQARLLKKVTQLRASSFETRPIVLIELNPKLLSSRLNAVTSLPELGGLVVGPQPELARSAPAYLATLLLVLKNIEELRAQASYLKLHQVAPGFTQAVSGLINNQPAVVPLDTVNLPWRSLQAFFGRATIQHLPSVFEPHLQASDLHWQSAERLLAKAAPVWRWWLNTSYVGLAKAKRPVSLNLTDLAIDNANQAAYRARATYYLQQAIWDELISRYMQIPVFAERVVATLEQQLLGADALATARPTRSLASRLVGDWGDL